MRCEVCGCEHDGSYGSGRFCSRICCSRYCMSKVHKKRKCGCTIAIPTACPVCGKEFRTKLAFRKHRAETKHYKPGKQVAFGNWKCAFCDKVFRTKREKQTHTREVHGLSTGWAKGLTKENSEIIRREVERNAELRRKGLIKYNREKCKTDEFRKKCSELRKKEYQDGRGVGWKKRTIESFPEKFWKTVLSNNDIHFDFNFPVQKSSIGLKCNRYYFLDFLLPGNVDLEIDGQQHRLPERIESDRIRDEALKSHGYTIYRVKWNSISYEGGKKQMEQKIEDFIEWYNNFRNNNCAHNTKASVTALQAVDAVSGSAGRSILMHQ